jgi:MOSC domain-containing protein YiiM
LSFRGESDGYENHQVGENGPKYRLKDIDPAEEKTSPGKITNNHHTNGTIFGSINGRTSFLKLRTKTLLHTQANQFSIMQKKTKNLSVSVVFTGRLVSLNVGLPRNVYWNGQEVATAIFKEPVPGPVTIRTLGLDGDEQADLSVHGGIEKAVYAYPAEHYDFWRAELGRTTLPWGSFGENLTIEGFLENTVHLGDEFRIGKATLCVTRPRFPCYKLGLKFGTILMLKQFQSSGRSGFYLSVLQQGEVMTGDRIELIKRNSSHPTVREVFMSEVSED